MPKPLRICLLGAIAAMTALSPGSASAQQPSAPLPPTEQAATEAGLVTLPSKHSVQDTIERFEAAVWAKQWVVFTRIDHAAAAEAAGLHLPPRTVVVFGNPKLGTEPMRGHPTLAIDLPLKALVWQDEAGGVFLTYNSADYMGDRIYPRHGIPFGPDARHGLAQFLDAIARQATE